MINNLNLKMASLSIDVQNIKTAKGNIGNNNSNSNRNKNKNKNVCKPSFCGILSYVRAATDASHWNINDRDVLRKDEGLEEVHPSSRPTCEYTIQGSVCLSACLPVYFSISLFLYIVVISVR